MMNAMWYREIEPGRLLAPYVRCFWALETDRAAASIERIVPDGRPEIAVHYRDRFDKWSPQAGVWEKQPRTLFIGQARESVLLRSGLRSGIVGIRFQYAGAGHFLRISMGETTNQILDLNDVSIGLTKELEERVVLARALPERIRIVREFLEKKLLDREPDSLVNHAVRMITDRQGQVILKNILEDLQISERQFERRFVDRIGVGPKGFARIIRFQNALRTIQSTPRINLTEAAMSFGYFDQAHFIKEFKQLSGLTPTSYISEAHQMSDHFTSN